MFDTSESGLYDLSRRPASPDVEFVAHVNDDDGMRRTINALSNANGGIVVVGVDPDRNFIGLSEQEANEAESRLRKMATVVQDGRFRTGTTSVTGRRVVFLELLSRATSDEQQRVPVAVRFQRFAIESCLLILLYVSSLFLPIHLVPSFLLPFMPSKFSPSFFAVVASLLLFFSLIFYGSTYEVTPLDLLRGLWGFRRRLTFGREFVRKREVRRDYAKVGTRDSEEVEEDGKPQDRDTSSSQKDGTDDRVVQDLLSRISRLERDAQAKFEAAVAVDADSPNALLSRAIDRASWFSNRMEKRTNTYLILGVLIGIVGLAVWYIAFSKINEQPTFRAYAQLALPRLAILLFIELLAGFFLRLYRIGVEDFKYFFETELMVTVRKIAYSVLAGSQDKAYLQKFADQLLDKQMVTKLASGENTPSLRASELESNIASDLIKQAAGVAQEAIKAVKGISNH
jgi:hypothetical protein